jgi:hypothetical protein
VALIGVTAREVSVAGVTVRVVDVETAPDVALMMVEPAATEIADPFDPAALLIVATVVFEELQVTEAVRSWVESSEKVPMAENCCFVPFAMLGLDGAIASDTSVAGFTVSVVDPETFAAVAVISVDPATAEVARPMEPALLLMVATVALEELQVTDAVRSCVESSE